jgi:hypothetical protein
VQTEIRIGVERAVVAEYADLVVADKDDAALYILEVGQLGDEFFRHRRFQLYAFYIPGAAQHGGKAE